MVSGISKHKEMYKRGPDKSIVGVLPNRDLAQTCKGSLQDTCDTERQDFRGDARLWCWPTRFGQSTSLSSAIRVGVRREGELGHEGEGANVWQ